MENAGIEKWIVIAIIALQLAYAVYAIIKISGLKKLIPDRKHIGVGREVIDRDPSDSTAEVDSSDNYTFESSAKGFVKAAPTNDEAATSPTYVLIAPNAASSAFVRIVDDINQYSRNKLGSVSDFALVKDVVDRPVDAELAQAEQRVSTPLYLGLLGAIAGIVAGVFALAGGMNGSVAPLGGDAAGEGADAFAALTGNLEGLLNAVGFAMIASGLGVLVTLILSLLTRRAEAVVDARRNDFFTFYQVEVLPKVSNNIDAVLQTLTGTLERFNTGFGASIKSLEGSLGSNLQAVESQADVLKQMQEINAKGIVGQTAKLYEQLSGATETLTLLLPNINRTENLMRTVGEAGEKFHATAGTVKRLGNLETSISTIIEHSVSVQAFMSRHMVDMDRANSSALGASQQIVEAFREHQAELRDDLRDVTTALRIIATNVEEVTRESIGDAQAKLAGLPDEIDGMVRSAFDEETVSTIKRSTRSASDAAERAELSSRQTEQLTAMIEVSLGRQTKAMSSLEKRSREHTELIRRMMTRRPWYRRMFAKDKGYTDGQS